ncbi:A/G-specific adenine glycosylase [Chelatococcus asaccharovorans]|uniref:Adenine DNA glycosylase n=1 Tax=Chelatococcus asaccharovorans TaxID=28210 RepID=A0A2V3U270_9HYPH|nr:A/G-specific adenine glycosylase [Chelatococcus asaccharovorans]MBS7702294.1 A/G-specific adenine glycosylase [Chelatococcus asaccharovorans]PXW56505.1 A/G-specific DNA-adenine glycosylase [Chelatococcus asaccharovorans]
MVDTEAAPVKSARKTAGTTAGTTARRGRPSQPAAVQADLLAPAVGTGLAEAAGLLAWYDRHRRDLPWRAKPGETADPYRVWLSEIMLQQTTVTAVKPYFDRFLQRFPTVGDLARAPQEAVMQAWAGLGYYSRARNLHACAQMVVARHGGHFPADIDQLRALPGIGAYTAAAVGAIAFGIPAAAVDGNVERVLARLYAVEEPLPKAKPLFHALAQALVPSARAGDFAQAFMDLGATICTPKRPACVLCPWSAPCMARAAGTAETFPRKAAKKEGTLRLGASFVAVRADGAVLLRTRPPEGLLGGMAELPGSPWTPDGPNGDILAHAPLQARWATLNGTVRHVFTHFPLELTVLRADVPRKTPAPTGMRWVAAAELDTEALPSLMRKVLVKARIEIRPV